MRGIATPMGGENVGLSVLTLLVIPVIYALIKQQDIH